MKAAVLHGPKDIRTETVPDPVLEAHGLVIKVKACGVCGSDLHVYKEGQEAGTIFGHEFSGEVLETGSQVADIKIGTRVTAVGYKPCGKCFWCAQGKGYRCSDMALLGYKFPGAMAEYVHIPHAVLGRTIFPLPEEMDFDEGASVEPLSVSYFSVNRAQPKAEESFAVIGLGIIGLNAVQVLKALGASLILASGRRPSRLEAAKSCGADTVIDAAGGTDPIKTILEATGNMGVNTVVECAGTQETFNQSLAMARGGGKILLVGVYEEPLTWDPQSVIAKNLSLIGCLGGHFPGSIELIRSGKAKVKPLITHRFSLDQADEAFRTQLQDPGAIKVMIIP
ncbi:MAG: alcohol dehydrogenase catalytic domain-containing protein [Thermodesulfobacteriota bacterium]